MESLGGSYGFLVIRPIFDLMEMERNGRTVLTDNPDVLKGLKSIVVRVKALVESAAMQANIPRIQVGLHPSLARSLLPPSIQPLFSLIPGLGFRV